MLLPKEEVRVKVGGWGVTYYQWERSQTGRGNVYPKQ